MEEPTTAVQTGEIITSALMNQVLERLDDLERETAFLMGSLGMDTHTVVAIGSGFESGGGIWLDGQLISGQPARGINLLILDYALHVKYQGTYNTADDRRNSVQLAEDLQTRAAAGDVVVAVTHEVYTSQLEETGRAALAGIGAAAVGDVADTHTAAAFIGLVPVDRNGPNFDFLVSVLPMDASVQLVGSPLAWGLYSNRLQTFLVGQAGNTTPSRTPPSVVESPPSSPLASPPMSPLASPPASPPAPAPVVTLSSLSLQQDMIAASTSGIGTVTLDEPAPAGGIAVTLSSTNPDVASVPGSTSIPEGQTSATFSITAIAPGQAAIVVSMPTIAPQSVTVTVVQALAISSLAFTPNTGAPGGTVTCTVALNQPAPNGGAAVRLTTDNPKVATIPSSILIPEGQQSGTCPVTTGSAGTVNISASLPGTKPQTTVLTVTPALAIASLILHPSSVQTGGSVTGMLTLTGPAPTGGATIELSSSNPEVVAVQPSITLVSGGSSIPFIVTAVAPGDAIITATLAGSPPQTSSLTVTPAPALSSLALNPGIVAPAAHSTGTVTLTTVAPDGGLSVAVASSDSQVATVPPSVLVPAGQTSVTFDVTAAATGTAVITVAFPGSATQSDTLTVRTQKTGKDGKEASKEAKDTREHKHVVEIPPVRGPGQLLGRLTTLPLRQFERPVIIQTGDTGARRRI